MDERSDRPSWVGGRKTFLRYRGVNDRLGNLLLYQSGWFVCVLGAAWNQPDLGAGLGLALVVVHLLLSRAPMAELRLVSFAAALGWLLVSVEQANGWLSYAGAERQPWAPVWAMTLWAQFGMALRGCLGWLRKSPVLASLFGALGGPLAFLGGERLGAVMWGPARLETAAWLAASWALVVPALSALARRWGQQAPEGYRWPWGR